MTIHFRTRAEARLFHAKRAAKALPGKVVDEGINYATKGKVSRYGVSLR